MYKRVQSGVTDKCRLTGKQTSTHSSSEEGEFEIEAEERLSDYDIPRIEIHDIRIYRNLQRS